MAKTKKVPFKPSHDSYGESEFEIPEKAPKRPADGDEPGNPEMTSLPDGDPRTKKSMISDMAHAFAQMSEADLAAMHSALFESCDEDDDEDENDDGDDVKVIHKVKKDEGDEYEDEDGVKLRKEDIDLSEHVNALFSGETVSEEFKSKATAIFEAAVLDAANEFAPRRQEVTEEVYNHLSETLSNFLDVVVEDWMKHNEIAIENSLQNEVMSKFASGLRTLFDECHVVMPEGKVDVMEEIVREHAELTEDYESLAEEFFDTKEELQAYQRMMIVQEISSALPAADAEKLIELASEMEFEDVDSFGEKVSTLAESYFGSGKQTLVEDTMETETVEDQPTKPVLSENIANAFSRMSVRKS